MPRWRLTHTYNFIMLLLTTEFLNVEFEHDRGEQQTQNTELIYCWEPRRADSTGKNTHACQHTHTQAYQS